MIYLGLRHPIKLRIAINLSAAFNFATLIMQKSQALNLANKLRNAVILVTEHLRRLCFYVDTGIVVVHSFAVSELLRL